jgi:hypothetical protein
MAGKNGASVPNAIIGTAVQLARAGRLHEHPQTVAAAAAAILAGSVQTPTPAHHETLARLANQDHLRVVDDLVLSELEDTAVLRPEHARVVRLALRQALRGPTTEAVPAESREWRRLYDEALIAKAGVMVAERTARDAQLLAWAAVKAERDSATAAGLRARAVAADEAHRLAAEAVDHAQSVIATLDEERNARARARALAQHTRA